jgi:hypothetical protein
MKGVAAQGLIAGRVPGTSPSDREGFNNYTRPEGKVRLAAYPDELHL